VLAAIANLTKVENRSVFWYRTRGSTRNQWLKTIKRAGIKTMVARNGRQGFPTTAPRNRIDPKTAAKLGGWKNMRPLMETYPHAIDDITLNEAGFDAPRTPTAQSAPADSKNPP